MKPTDCYLLLLAKGCPAWKAERLISYAVRNHESLDELAERWHDVPDSEPEYTIREIFSNIFGVIIAIGMIFACTIFIH